MTTATYTARRTVPKQATSTKGMSLADRSARSEPGPQVYSRHAIRTAAGWRAGIALD
jgi:hypothetical protein